MQKDKDIGKIKNMGTAMDEIESVESYIPVEIDPATLPKRLKVADERGILLVNLEEYSEMILDDSPIRERRGSRERFYLADKRLAIRMSAQGYAESDIANAIEMRRRENDLPVEGITATTVKKLVNNYKIEIDAMRYLWRLQLGRLFKVADPIYRTRVLNSITKALIERIFDDIDAGKLNKDTIDVIKLLIKTFSHVQGDAGEDGSIKAFKYIVNEVRKEQTDATKKKRLGIE